MTWSLPLGRIFGVPIKVHFTFFFLLAYVYYLWTHGASSHKAGLLAVLFTCVLFACVLAHELGHSLMARAFGTRTRSIVLLPIGGVALLEHIPREPYKEILIALAGPFVSVLLSALFFFLSPAPGAKESLEMAQHFSDLSLGDFATILFVINAILVVFNLIPAFPMDGGRVFRGLLSLALGWERGTIWAVRIGQTFAFGFIVLGLLWPDGGHIGLLLAGFFILFGAAEEGRLARIRGALEGATAANAMLRTFVVLAPDDTLRSALLKNVDCNQDDFPVVADGTFLGMAHYDTIIDGVKRFGPSAQVGEIVRREFARTAPDAPLEELYMQLARTTRRTLPVMENGSLAGLISLDQINRFARLRRTLRLMRRAAPRPAAPAAPPPPPLPGGFPPPPEARPRPAENRS